MEPSQRIELVPVAQLKPYARNARTHSRRQIEQLAASIARFGFTNPLLISEDLTVLAGHGRLAAAKKLGWESVPVVRLSALSETEQRAYVLADNRLAEKAGWDVELRAVELADLQALEVDLTTGTGFELPEIDILLCEANAASTDEKVSKADFIPALEKVAVSRPGDVWILGRHRVICGDARDASAYEALLEDERAHLIFTDPPYNVPVSGHVRTGGGHREFAMASGEMSQEAFTDFLKQTLGEASSVCKDGAVAYVCMDWRHIREVMDAGDAAFDAFINLCVWKKTNGGMGSFYRSQHELVFVYKKGQAPHRNNVQLGRFGRDRTNVWVYSGVNAFKANRESELDMHPTVKPVKLIEDAIADATARNEIVLDPFGGSGSTLIAAQACGRRARLIEIDPLYCDVVVKRFEKFTGKVAMLASANDTFEQVAIARHAAA